MEIREAGKMTLCLAETAVQTAEVNLQFVKENLGTLNINEQGNNEDQESEKRASHDPSAFLNKKEKRFYDRLSVKKKKQYLKSAMDQKNRDSIAMRSAGITMGKAAAEAKTAVASSGAAGIKTAAASAGAAATAGASAGADVAFNVGKKVAKTFKESLESRSLAAENKLSQMRRNLEEKNSNAKTGGGKQSPASAAASAIALPLVIVGQAAMASLTSAIAIMGTVVAAVAAIILPAVLVLVMLYSNSFSAGAGAERIVEVALTQENNTDGSPYWEFTMGSRFVNGNTTPWCACFVSWCANECGYIDDNIFPKTGSVASYRRYYTEKGLWHDRSGYTPKAGDLIVFSPSHIGIVQYVEDGIVVTIEGNTSDAVHTRRYSLDNPRIIGYCTPEYPGGDAIMIPKGMGDYHTYMGWHTVTSKTSLQYQLRESSGEHYDEEGFARINDRYVIACTTTFGRVGDYIDFYRENGEVIHAVIGDIKNQNDPGCNEYGHDGGRCVVEYVVSKSWYPSHANPGTSGCHPEWDSRVVKAVNLGTNYFD